ncbi:MAG TPA: TetR/AcrR family transcriptional regulator [Fimbriimonas sp.]|nr:TetR/AcrR family transcriptional regulator [Fimbriimonas sp.]
MRPARKSYHHGNLRQALIDKALESLASKQDDLSLRALAVEAGVSPNAPYRHFKDKDALLAAIADFGFRQLSQQLKQVEAEGSNRRFREMADRYVKFALANQALYGVMMSHGAGDGLKTCQDLVEEFVRVVTGEVTANDSVHKASTATWSLLHGYASLSTTVKGEGFDLTLTGEDLARMLSKGIR